MHHTGYTSSHPRPQAAGLVGPQLPDLNRLSLRARGSNPSFVSDTSSQTAVSINSGTHIHSRPIRHQPIGNPGNNFYERVDLRLSSTGSACFDYVNDDDERIAPRTVKMMHVYSEQSGDMHEWIVLKVSDLMHDKSVWVRFCPYLDVGDFTYKESSIAPRHSALRATLYFENGIDYQDTISTRSKVMKQSLGTLNPENYALYASVYAEVLSLHIGSGLGRCTPHHLCEIWPSLPDWERRMQAFYWYEEMDGSGREYIVLHIVGSSSYSEIQNWWVQLERDGAIDIARISRHRDLVAPHGSKEMRRVVYEDGIPFENIANILCDIPLGFSFATEDCWYYASTLACRLSVEVGDDVFECPTEDLEEIWSGERGAQLLVNRIQWFKALEGDQEYLIMNVSANKSSKRGLWIRLGQEPILGLPEDTACVTGNRRHLLRTDLMVLADITFTELRFGKVTKVLKEIDCALKNMLSIDAKLVSKSAITVQELTQNPDIECYWAEGDWVMLSAQFSS